MIAEVVLNLCSHESIEEFQVEDIGMIYLQCCSNVDFHSGWNVLLKCSCSIFLFKLFLFLTLRNNAINSKLNFAL